MMALTLGGQVGAGELEIGRLMAKELEMPYVYQQAIRRLARYLNASVEAVVRKEMAFSSYWKRAGHMLEAWLSQMGRTGSEPWSMPLLSTLASPSAPRRRELPGEISNSDYREGVFAVAQEYAMEGNVVLAHRAGCLVVEDTPGVVHVGLFAPRDMRVQRIARQYRIGNLEASDWLDSMDQARAAWFRELAGAHPHDPDLYDITVDATGFMDDAMAARSIARAAIDLRDEMMPEREKAADVALV